MSMSTERATALGRSQKKEEVAKMPALFHRRLAWLSVSVLPTVAVLLLVAHGATAQSATGSISGRVMWGPCVRGIPLPMAPDAQAQPGAPEAPNTMPQPAPGSLRRETLRAAGPAPPEHEPAAREQRDGRRSR